MREQVVSFETAKLAKEKGFDTNISLVDRVNPPLFTTKDGVDIYDGMTAYAVGLREFELNKIFKVSCCYAIGENYNWFSTRNAAKNYILMNSICLTGQDILDYLESVNLKVTEGVDPEFIKFIKTRLKSREL